MQAKKPMIKSDLHIHTLHSDGAMSVGEVMDIAKFKGFDCIAITDHDTVSGVSDAMLYGKEIGLKVVPGIELSAYSVMAVHILGYGIDYNSPALLELLNSLLEQRQVRAMEIVEKLKRFNILIDTETLPKVNVGRSHIAMALKNAGYVSNIQEAFDKYLGENRLAYVPSKRINPSEAVQAIKDSGGMAVIAHPLQLYNTKKLIPLIEGLKKYGLDGLEVYYPTHTQDKTAMFEKIAKDYKLFATGGSDFHGANKNNTINNIGETYCNLPFELRRNLK